jgi:hypothetical protein
MKIVTVRKIDGQVKCDTDLGYLFSTLKNGVYTLTIKRASEKRTLPQNDLMWLWFTCIESETGTSKQDVYLHYCKKFLSKPDPLGDGLISEGSSKLNTAQMADFMKKIQADASAEFGINLPVPEDRYFEHFFQQFNI